MSCGSSVNIVSDYRLDGRGSIPNPCKGFFSLACLPIPALRSTQPPIQCVPGVFSQGENRPSRNPDLSPLSSAEVQND
jgi:hypothetical protein